MNSIEKIHSDLMRKVGAEPEFRKSLLANPKAAIEAELGISIPEDVNVKVHENDMNTIHLALPVADLSEEQLEAVAAGRCCCCG